jgi:hypothetical protein
MRDTLGFGYTALLLYMRRTSHYERDWSMALNIMKLATTHVIPYTMRKSI